MAAEVAHYRQSYPDYCRGARSKSVEPVGEVGSVAHSRHHKDSNEDKHNPATGSSMLAHPASERSVVEVIIFHKGYSGLRSLHRLALVQHCHLVVSAVFHLHILVHHDGRTEIHGKTHNQSESYLTHDLEFPLQSVLVVVSHLDVVVGKAEGTEPQRSHNHENHVDIVEHTHQEARNENGNDDNHATHRGGSFLAHLSLKSEVAHNLTHLHQLQAVDNLAANHRGNEKRQHKSHSRAECDVAHQSGTGNVKLHQIFR